MSSEFPKSIWFNPMENRDRFRFGGEETELWRKWGKEYLPKENCDKRIAELEQAIRECMYDKSISRNTELEEEVERQSKAIAELTAEANSYFKALKRMQHIAEDATEGLE